MEGGGGRRRQRQSRLALESLRPGLVGETLVGFGLEALDLGADFADLVAKLDGIEAVVAR